MIKNELILYKLNNGCEKILCGPEKVHPVGMRERVVSFCHGQAERRKGDDPNTMGQTKQARGLASLGRAELAEALDELGELTVTCEFCNRRYVFDRVDVEAALAGEGTPAGSATRH